MAEKNNYPIRVLDMTNLFSKELLIYSLFDIKFKKPVRLIFGFIYLSHLLFGEYQLDTYSLLNYIL